MTEDCPSVVVQIAEESRPLLGQIQPLVPFYAELGISSLQPISVWEVIPAEIWAHILLWQDPAYLHDSISVCKLWAKILTSTEFLLKKRHDIQKHLQLVLLGPPSKDWLNPPEKWNAIISNHKIEAYCPVTCSEEDPELVDKFWEFIQSHWHATIHQDSELDPPPLEVAIYYQGVYKRVCFVFISPITETGGCHARLFLVGKSHKPPQMDFSKFASSRFHTGSYISLQLLSIFSRSKKNAPPILLHFSEQEEYTPPIQTDVLNFDDEVLPTRLRIIEGKPIEPSMKRYVLHWYNKDGELECPSSEDLLLGIWKRKLSNWKKSKDQLYEQVHVERCEKLQQSLLSFALAFIVSFVWALALAPVHAFINLILFWFCVLKQFWCVGFILGGIGTASWMIYLIYSFYLVFKRVYDYGFPYFIFVSLDRIKEDFEKAGFDWGCQDVLNFHESL